MVVKGLLAVAAVALLAGCGDASKLKSIVKENLIDPDSAKFGDLVMDKTGHWACLEVNAKNRMGGYGGTQLARFTKDGDDWALVGIDENYTWCTEEGHKW